MTTKTGRAKCIPKEPERVFLPYQQKWIDDMSRLKIMEKSRQIGISWGTAYAVVEHTAPVENRNDQWVSSRDDIRFNSILV